MVYHIMKDGRMLTDITGHFVPDTCIDAYNIIARMNERVNAEKQKGNRYGQHGTQGIDRNQDAV